MFQCEREHAVRVTGKQLWWWIQWRKQISLWLSQGMFLNMCWSTNIVWLVMAQSVMICLKQWSTTTDSDWAECKRQKEFIKVLIQFGLQNPLYFLRWAGSSHLSHSVLQRTSILQLDWQVEKQYDFKGYLQDWLDQMPKTNTMTGRRTVRTSTETWYKRKWCGLNTILQ